MSFGKKWIKTWCCQSEAKRYGNELHCTCCNNQVFDDYAVQKLIIKGEPYDPNELVTLPRTASFQSEVDRKEEAEEREFAYRKDEGLLNKKRGY